MEMTNCTLLARVEALGLLENKLAEFTATKEAEKAALLAQKEEEHKQHLAQVRFITLRMHIIDVGYSIRLLPRRTIPASD
jgi:hypothetical protein